MTTRMAPEQRGRNARAIPGRRQRRRRRGRQRAHFLTLILFLLGLGLILSFTVFWKIEAVRVIGADKYDPDLIAADSGVVLEDNLLRINKEEITARIMEKYPYIASVEVHRKLPPAVEITVTQSKPDGAIQKGGEIILITKEGKVLERGTILIPEKVPLVMGIEADGPPEAEEGEEPVTDTVVRTAPGGYLPKAEEEKLVMLGNLLAAMEETGFTSITNVDLSDRLNIRIIYENRILMRLGVEAELAHKLETVQYLLAEKIGPEERGTLDVSEVDKWTIFSPEFGESRTLEPGAGAPAQGETDKPPGDTGPPESGGTDEPGEETAPSQNEENPV